ESTVPSLGRVRALPATHSAVVTRKASPSLVTVIVPDRSVLNTRLPASSSSASAPGSGCPYPMPSPTPTRDTAAAAASKNSGTWNAEPWWGTFNTSTFKFPRLSSSARCASRSTSPVNSTLVPATSARTATELLFGSERVPRIGCSGGESTSNRVAPNSKTSPGDGASTGTAPALSATRSNPYRASPGGGARIASTSLPSITPAIPAVWSMWKWESTSSATRSTPRPSRQASTAAASGPASTTTTASPAGSTSASPWPTSHIVTTQPEGGPPANRQAGTEPRAA